jgi:hypothetical protein
MLIPPPQVPLLPPMTPVQVTFTADVGTVGQLVNEAALACTASAQVLFLLPLEVIQLIVAAELPATEPRSGSVAVKLMVLGLAEMALKVVGPAIGMIMFDGTTTLAFLCAKLWLALQSANKTDIRRMNRFM